MSAPTATREPSLKDLWAEQKKDREALNGLTKSLNGLVDKLSKETAPGFPSGNDLFGSPHIRYGEDPMSSRGYSFLKMLGLATGQIKRDEAKVEGNIADKLHNCFVKELGQVGYTYGAKGIPGAGTFLAPLASDFMHESIVPTGFRNEMRDCVRAGTRGADPDNMGWLVKRLGSTGQKTLSWLWEDRGGAIVQPPEQGELIELLRNKEALVNAGARTVPLPPQGRLQYPRQTMASNTYWVGENSPITSSDIGTGMVTLQAKKLTVLIRTPNELIRFASPAAEALIRDDMTKSLALGLDLACLEGQGGDNRPLGIINRAGITRVTSSQPGADGDAVVGNDLYRCVAALEEANAEFKGWICRPKLLYKYYQLRSDAVAQGDKQGPWLFNLIREAGDGIKPKLAGHDVTTSTQVSQSQSKGSASNLTYLLGGMWDDYLIGMFGAIEFAATTLGDTPFVQDQTWVRGILSADAAPRHEASFVLLQNLIANG